MTNRASIAGRMLLAVASLALLALPGCEGIGGGQGDASRAGVPSYIETGDLEALRERGMLRILVAPMEPATLPRNDFALNTELRLAKDMAKSLGLDPEVIRIRDRREMLEALLEGRGDLLVAGLTVTDTRRERFAFTIPLQHEREMLVVPLTSTDIATASDLDGRSVAVRASSSFHETLRALKSDVPGMRIVAVPEYLDTATILDQVARGEYDAAVADESLAEATLAFRDDLRIAFPLSGERPVAWALRPENPELKVAADRFLHERALGEDLAEIEAGDLDAIRERKVLRVLTRNTAATYFLHRGTQVGFEFEWARRFARSIGCRLQIVVPPEFDQLIPWLLEGRGDLIAAGLTVTDERAERVAFGRPYNTVTEMLVARADDPIASLEELAGRRVAVVKANAYYETLVALQRLIPFEIDEAPEGLETEDLIAAVAEGERDLTVSDSTILDIELAFRDDVRPALALGEPRPIAWAMRPRDEQLIEEVDAFVRREYRGTFFNVLQDKYFKNRGRIARAVAERPRVAGRISPFDDLFRRYGDAVEVDWRLLAAQAYQESRFRPQASSWAGAVGVMQLLPRTAREMGVDGDLHDPENGIRAGSAYLRHLRDRFEPTLPLAERTRFALAAYNVGRGHVQDGRRLARELGLDPDVWFDNVERALPLLSKQQYASAARYGYCRCREPVHYVRNINNLYAAYARVVD